MAPISAPKLGVHFFGGHISLKNGTFCPLSSHDSSSFKDTCLFIYLKWAKVAFYGPHLHWCLHRLFHNYPFQLSFSWFSVGNRLRLVLKLAKEVQSLTRAENIFSLHTQNMMYCIRSNDTPSNGVVVTPDRSGATANESSLCSPEGRLLRLYSSSTLSMLKFLMFFF
jgi:hypothetical protein